jgi:hypothetical protein
LIGQAVHAGIKEEEVESYLNNNNINDYNLQNLKTRLGIVDPKPERKTKRATVVAAPVE